MIPTLIIFLPHLFMSSFFISVTAILVSTNCFAASCSRNSVNIRNPLICYANRYFLMFSGSQVQKPYHASMNGFSTFWPWHHDTTFFLNVYYFFHFYAYFLDWYVYLCTYSYFFYVFMQYDGIIFTLFLPYFLFRLKSATISVLRNAIRASIFLASTRAEMRKLWLLTALPLPV